MQAGALARHQHPGGVPLPGPASTATCSSILRPTTSPAGEKTRRQRDTFRLGGRHSFSPGSVLLASYMHLREHGQTSSRPTPVLRPDTFLSRSRPGGRQRRGAAPLPLARRRRHEPARLLQHRRRDPELGSRPGLGFTASGRRHHEASTQPIRLRLRAYANLKPRASGDLFDAPAARDVRSRPRRAMPAPAGRTTSSTRRSGSSGSRSPATTLRAAGSRRLKRTLVTDQTLEPTQVAGFNQFFDDADVTEAGVRGRPSTRSSARRLRGLEYSQTRPHVPPVRPRRRRVTVEGGRERRGWPGPTCSRRRTVAGLRRAVPLRAASSGPRARRRVPRAQDASGAALGVGFFHPSGRQRLRRPRPTGTRRASSEPSTRPRPCVRAARILAGRRGLQLSPAEALRVPRRRGDEPVRRGVRVLRGTDPKNLDDPAGPVIFGRVMLAFP